MLFLLFLNVKHDAVQKKILLYGKVCTLYFFDDALLEDEVFPWGKLSYFKGDWWPEVCREHLHFLHILVLHDHHYFQRTQNKPKQNGLAF